MIRSDLQGYGGIKNGCNVDAVLKKHRLSRKWGSIKIDELGCRK